MSLRIGDVFHGYCGGAFGRDGFGDKRVEALGSDWVVIRYDESHHSDAVTFGSSEEMEADIESWLQEKGEPE